MDLQVGSKPAVQALGQATGTMEQGQGLPEGVDEGMLVLGEALRGIFDLQRVTVLERPDDEGFLLWIDRLTPRHQLGHHPSEGSDQFLLLRFDGLGILADVGISQLLEKRHDHF